ncbi:MAG TPA: sensor domain-containing protein [Trebonia sp.]|nr:sensor domain-containing protein [Trebonia sp.]
MATLSARRDPVRLALSRAPWSAAWYLLGYLVISGGLFSIAVTGTALGAGLSITLLGIPVLSGAAVVIRWCADAERARLSLVAPGPVTARYREPAGNLLDHLRARWTDPVIWRDLGYLLGMFIPLLGLDTIVLAIWLALLAGITVPAWYWAPYQTVHGVRYHGYQLGYFPNGPHGHPGYGLYVDTLPKALLVAVVCLVAVLLFNYVLVATARAHAFVARSLLGEQTDPLREAKEILRGPGPLSAAQTAGCPGL